MFVRTAIFLLTSSLVLGCNAKEGDGEGDDGTDDGGGITEVDCTWLGSQNCWRDAVDATRPCVPDEELTATLSADRLSCVYDDGSEVLFDYPVAADPIDTEIWSFEVRTGGSSCVSYTNMSTPGAAALEVVTSDGLIHMEGDIDDVLLTCPDGSRYRIPDYLDLYQSCPAAQGGLPLLTIQSTGDEFGLEFSDEVDGQVPLLWCAQ